MRGACLLVARADRPAKKERKKRERLCGPAWALKRRQMIKMTVRLIYLN